MSLLNSIGSSPILKTLFSQVVGAAFAAMANTADVALSNPSGGTTAYLTAHPLAGIAYVCGVSLFHNFVSKYVPPTSLAPAPSQTTPAK